MLNSKTLGVALLLGFLVAIGSGHDGRRRLPAGSFFTYALIAFGSLGNLLRP